MGAIQVYATMIQDDDGWAHGPTQAPGLGYVEPLAGRSTCRKMADRHDGEPQAPA
jgi:hypothetical protein